MLLDIVKKGVIDRSVILRIIDSADGTPETGVVFNTSGIDLWYRREGAAVVSITEATLAALTTAHADGGFLHVSHGYYRLDLPDAAFATAANYVDVGGTVTGMVVLGGRVRLVDIDLEVAAIPANVTQFGGSNLTSASGIPEVKVNNIAASAITAASIAADAITAAKVADGTIDAATFAASAITASALAADAITAAKIADGAIDAATFAAGAITATAIAADAITAAKIANGAIDAATFAADVDAEVLSYLVDDATRIDASALNTAAVTTIPDILTDTAEIGAAGAGLTNINLPNQTMDIIGNITGNLSGSVGSVTGSTAQTGDSFARLGAPAGASVSADIAAEKALLVSLGLTTGTVTTDGSNSAASFETDLSSSVNDFWKDAFLLLTSGALAGQVKKVTAYNGTTKFITVSGGYTSTPADAVTFVLINR